MAVILFRQRFENFIMMPTHTHTHLHSYVFDSTFSNAEKVLPWPNIFCNQKISLISRLKKQNIVTTRHLKGINCFCNRSPNRIKRNQWKEQKRKQKGKCLCLNSTNLLVGFLFSSRSDCDRHTCRNISFLCLCSKRYFLLKKRYFLLKKILF